MSPVPRSAGTTSTMTTNRRACSGAIQEFLGSPAESSVASAGSPVGRTPRCSRSRRHPAAGSPSPLDALRALLGASSSEGLAQRARSGTIAVGVPVQELHLRSGVDGRPATQHHEVAAVRRLLDVIGEQAPIAALRHRRRWAPVRATAVQLVVLDVQDDRPERGAAHPAAGDAHNVAHLLRQQFLGDRGVADLRHTGRDRADAAQPSTSSGCTSRRGSSMRARGQTMSSKLRPYGPAHHATVSTWSRAADLGAPLARVPVVGRRPVTSTGGQTLGTCAGTSPLGGSRACAEPAGRCQRRRRVGCPSRRHAAGIGRHGRLRQLPQGWAGASSPTCRLAWAVTLPAAFVLASAAALAVWASSPPGRGPTRSSRPRE